MNCRICNEPAAINNLCAEHYHQRGARPIPVIRGGTRELLKVAIENMKRGRFIPVIRDTER